MNTSERIIKAVIESHKHKNKGCYMDSKFWFPIADFIEDREKRGKDRLQIFGELVEIFGVRI